MTQVAQPMLQRLDDQIVWYDRASVSAQFWFKALKIVQLVAAAIIPLFVLFGVPNSEKVAAVLGLIILIVEGLQQLNKYETNWIRYRSTCEALKHERYLFKTSAGPYAKAEQAIPALVQRIDDLISQEQATSRKVN
jgi:hypothetical protein